MNQPHQPGKNFLPGNFKTLKSASAVSPHSADNRIILCFGDINGTLETDLAKQLVKRWPKVNTDFRQWYRGQTSFKLGSTLTIPVQTDTEVICLLVLNQGVLNLEAFKKSIISTVAYAVADKKNIHINKTAEHWEEIETLLIEYFIKSSVNVNVYEVA